MRPKLTLEQRLRLIREFKKGRGVAEICRHFSISRTLFYRFKRRYQELGQVGLEKGIKKLRRKRLASEQRIEAIKRVVKGKESVSKIAEEFGISRFTFYYWIKRFRQDPSRESLIERYRKGSLHWHSTPESVKKLILEIVLAHPEYSCQKILKICKQDSLSIGHHGIQNILEKSNLSTYAKRLAWAESQKAKLPSKFDEIWVSSRLRTLRFLIAPFATIPKLATAGFELVAGISRPIFGVPVLGTIVGGVIFGIYEYFVLLSTAPSQTRAGLVAATFALFFGLIFFLYSLKYYLSAILVLLVPGRKKENQPPGLIADVSEVKLEKYPFVSIHIPLYNEKKVAERILKATLAQDYPKDKYEVIVADDSTDETTEIVKKFETDRILESSRTGLEHPRVRVIHRDNREGFKGGALEEARKITDSRAEYIIIFDADFIPFPDTIQQFMKYFKIAQIQNSKFKIHNSQHVAAVQGYQPHSAEASRGEVAPAESKIAAIQGYQWHVLNKSENWITRGVRCEYAGSYIVERSATEIYQGLKMIAGSVYCIRRDILDKFGWGTSITEDFQLTLRLYQQGYKVIYTPYIQTPSECVSTIRRLVRQRMRWAEGHTFNIKKYLLPLLFGKGNPKNYDLRFRNYESNIHKSYLVNHKSLLSLREKLEFIYLAPYYLQAAFFMVGTISWFLSEAVFHTRLPFWTATFGWSLVFTNFLALPLINTLGLFLEESEKKDYLGILSFIALAYIVTPFQAYAAVKGLIESQEGPWFRTPKTGLITDVIGKVRLGFWWRSFGRLRIPWGKPVPAQAFNFQPQDFSKLNLKPNIFLPDKSFTYNLRPKRLTLIGRSVLTTLLILSLTVNYFVVTVPQTLATNPASTTWYFRDQVVGSTESSEKDIYCVTATDCKIVFHDDTNDDLYFIDCDDATCSVSTTTLLDGATGCALTNCASIATGHFASIYCLSSTDCKIAYRDNSNQDLRFADCENSACSSGTTLLLDGRAGCLLTNCADGDVGQYTSIYCPAADDCKIAYYDVGGADLEFADCADDGVTTDGECESGTTTTVDFSATTIGQLTSTFCPSDGSPSQGEDCKITYIDVTNTAIKMADCGNNTCSTVTLTVLDGNTGCTLSNCSTTRTSGQGTSIYCPGTADCKVSFQDDGADDLWFADCADASCGTGSTSTLLDGAAGCVLTNCASSSIEGAATSIYCVSASDCKITYRRDGTLRMADCDDVDCDSAGNTDTTTLLDGATGCVLTNCSTTSNSHARDNSIYCSATDDCKVFNFVETPADIKFADCDNATCGSGTTITLDGNKKINGTAGAVTTTQTINTSGQIYTLVTNVEYPTGDDAGSLGTGDHTLHVDFTNLNAAGENITFHFHVGYCTIASDCGTKTSHVESGATTWDDTTTSPQNITVNAGSATSIPIPKETKWLYTEIHVTAVTGASPGFTMNMNNSAGGTADSNILIPALTVPEFIGFLVPVAPFLPRLVRRVKEKLKGRRKGKKLWRPI